MDSSGYDEQRRSIPLEHAIGLLNRLIAPHEMSLKVRKTNSAAGVSLADR
jgi:hypothetical protein